MSTPSSSKDPVEQARDNLLNKASKLELAQQAILTQHLGEIARDDVEGVRQLKAKYLGGQGGQGQGGADVKGDDVGDIIVCDDYHRGDTRQNSPSRLWPIVGAVAGGSIVTALALAGISQMLPGRQIPAEPPAQMQTQQPKNTTIYQKKGFILDLPGAEK